MKIWRYLARRSLRAAARSHAPQHISGLFRAARFASFPREVDSCGEQPVTVTQVLTLLKLGAAFAFIGAVLLGMT
ncbi:hypothetical protein [Xanthobacter tagetidis]|uniref:hypothetical protein n=1 Tax=Xanthobacter tagetidis TaxID=60216 RepID=UPI0011C44170|nr:hypothetical protein [Xanthobacter tagetidis]MBB6306562.1 hypothetical protein [Xanthobacter tagetidis]